ncbi:ThuA domain-containing protein [bacterium]|nr:ThuA domain-containing protein [bacterium]
MFRFLHLFANGKSRFVRCRAAFLVFALLGGSALHAEEAKPTFHAVAFYTGRSDLAHISFVKEAREWFPRVAKEHGFSFQATTNWADLNPEFLKNVQVVLFLDTRPEKPEQRKAFEDYMKHGGAWMGFHFSAFALTPSAYPQNWDWYHDDFLGSDQYVSNTWRPTSAVLRVEDKDHPATRGLPETFKSSPNEWYRWKGDLRGNPNIKVLLSIDPTSFPLGTGPKQHEIWHSGDYPVVWTNTKFRMIYFNMGHNDMDYGGTNKSLSATFDNDVQNKLIVNSLMWLGTGEGK